MIDIPQTPETRLAPAPVHACEPVTAALKILSAVVDEQGGPDHDVDTDAGQATHISNEISRICGNLCSNGCARQEQNAVESLGLSMPTSPDRERLGDYVSNVLMIEFIVSEEGPQESNGPVVIELNTDAAQIKEIVTRRLDLLTSPSFHEYVVSNSDMDITAEDFGRMIESKITPVEEEAWEALSKLVNGNVRAALRIMSYLIGIHQIFQSDDPDSVALAEKIAGGQSIRDESWEQKTPGFRPEKPGVITAKDFFNLSKQLSDKGGLHLYDGIGGPYVSIEISEEVQKWRDQHGEKVVTTRNGVEIED